MLKERTQCLRYVVWVSALLVMATGCSSAAKDADETTPAVDEGALEAAMSTSALVIACRTLGAVGECGRVTVCETKTTASCRATDGARASNAGWEAMCPQAGADEAACASLTRFCRWDATAQCAPRAGAAGAGADAQGTDRQVTCKLLGAVDQCANVSLCKAEGDAHCMTKRAYAADVFWKDYCPQLSFGEGACKNQSYCQWEHVATCMPLDE